MVRSYFAARLRRTCAPQANISSKRTREKAARRLTPALEHRGSVMATDKLEPPVMTKGDAAHAITRAGLAAIPLFGGTAVELFQHLLQPPLERRRSEWMAAVGEKLKELEDHGVNIEELGKNDEFVSAVMHATQIALRTHQTEKREALRNAVLNLAAGQSPGEALEHMFFDLIDSLSVLHIQILRLFQDPTPPPGMSMGGLSSVLEYNMPQPVPSQVPGYSWWSGPQARP